jgi:RES domain-containing protein
VRRVWRLCRRKYAASAFDGEGARRFGGRWNPPGVRVVYASETISLAALEALVHFDPTEAPDDLVVIPVDIPTGVEVAERTLRILPATWRSTPGSARLQELGADWVRAGKTAVLAVPSVVVPEERNYLLNPGHPDFARVKRGRPKAFSIDPRLYG